MNEQLTKEGFLKLWYRYVDQGFGYMVAYDKAEEEHFKRYGSFRYANYNAFRSSRDKGKRK